MQDSRNQFGHPEYMHGINGQIMEMSFWAFEVL